MDGFGEILLFLIAGWLFVGAGLFALGLIRVNRPNTEKLTSYECGEEPVGNAWGQFNIKFYVVALMFLLFDVELLFLFPWATVFGISTDDNRNLWGWFSIYEMALFVSVLAIGLAYVWKKGFLDWGNAQNKNEAHNSKALKMYQGINKKYRA